MLSEITAAMAEAYFERRYEDVGRETAQREISTLPANLYKAHRQGVLERVPTFPRLKTAKPRKRWLSLEEEDRLVRSAAPHFAALIRFAVETGGRRYELLMLDWRQLELEDRRCTFLDTKNSEDRIIRLSRRASAVPASLGPKPSGPVFTYNGKADQVRQDLVTASLTMRRI
ncbi:MAG: hypothetical protein O7I42_05850 [Alphaproteobacteria bacterium]|nr:hypothetical protein [Alphaproteobacteria bacterium]